MKMLNKKMLSILPALLFSTVAAAEPFWAAKPVQCGTPKEVVDITKQFDESPSILMEGYMKMQNGSFVKSKIVIATNKKTETWTILEFPEGGLVGCIVSTGRGFKKLVDIGTPL